MAKLPDLSAYSADELHELIGAANKRIDELTKARLADLQKQKNAIESEMAKLGGAKPSSGGGARAKPKPQFRTPDGFEYTGRGAIPKTFRDLGVETREQLEQYRIKA